MRTKITLNTFRRHDAAHELMLQRCTGRTYDRLPRHAAAEAVTVPPAVAVPVELVASAAGSRLVRRAGVARG